MRLFDTTFIIDMVNGHPAALRKAQELDQDPALKGISVITAHEYLFGVYRIHKDNNKSKSRVNQALKDLAHFHILPLDYTTVKISAELHANLSMKGQLLGINDIYIAATALQHHLMLVTRDKDFSRVGNLKLDSY